MIVVTVGLGGCLPELPHPVTAADVASLDSGGALVAYLGQRDANPVVCNSRSGGGHLSHFDQPKSEELVAGLHDGRVDPGLWRRCVEAAFDARSPADGVALLDAIGHGYLELATDSDLEKSPALQPRLAALQAVYIERPRGQDGDPKVMAPIFDELRHKFFSGRLGPVAARFVGELLSVVDLEQGRYGGRPVDVATIEDIAARGDENLLRRFADRLPSQGLRDEARRRLIRLAIAASPFAEVRKDAAAVEERVMRLGANRISLAEQPARRASLDAGMVSARTVVVRQDLWHQAATLLGQAEGGGLSVLPDLSLSGALWVDVDGLSRPVTICRAARGDDPTPCIGAADVTIENPLAVADGGGKFHFRDRPSESEALGATGTSDWFPLSVDVAGRRLVGLRWPLRYERPSDLVFSSPSGRGADLKVTVTRASPSLFSFTVSNGASVYRGALEKSDLSAFHIVSRGASGTSGQNGFDGLDGTSGMDGSNASCPSLSGGSGTNGSSGSRGDDGGDGSDGADGGDIRVQVDCGALSCSAAEVDVLRRVAVSQGGPGGSGGRGGHGGKGGRGGRGGSGTTCTDSHGATSSVGGGSDGFSGSDGLYGRDGSNGSPGRPGQVRVQITPQQPS
jgi:hypothetical protein